MTLANMQIIKLLAGKWKHIAVIAVIAAVAGAVVSMPVFMKPKYKSESVVYPANLGTFSLESPTEQLMQLLQSRKLKARLLRELKLWDNYKLDTTDVQFDFYYTQMFDEHVKFNQTRFESVIIEVFDRDPKMAKKINSGILTALNEMVREMHDEKTREALSMYGLQLQRKKVAIDSLDRQMTEMRTKYGILNYGIQTKEASRNYYKALSSGKSKESLGKLMEEIEMLKQRGGQFQLLERVLNEEILEYENVKKEYDAKVRDLGKRFTYTSIVAEPNLPVKKAWPVRWLVVMMFVISAVFLSVIYYLITDRIKKTVN